MDIVLRHTNQHDQLDPVYQLSQTLEEQIPPCACCRQHSVAQPFYPAEVHDYLNRPIKPVTTI